jgi:hypothetical protein
MFYGILWLETDIDWLGGRNDTQMMTGLFREPGYAAVAVDELADQIDPGDISIVASESSTEEAGDYHFSPESGIAQFAQCPKLFATNAIQQSSGPRINYNSIPHPHRRPEATLPPAPFSRRRHEEQESLDRAACSTALSCKENPDVVD